MVEFDSVRNDKFKVYLLTYSEELSYFDINRKYEEKIFFSKDKMRNFMRDNVIYSPIIRTVDIEDVEYLEYKLKK